MKFVNWHNNKGFTVIELIISMSLFVVISGMIVSSFIIAMRTQRTIMALVEAKDNMGLAVERFAREARMGTNFVKTSNTELNFTSINGTEIRYYYDDNDYSIKRCENFNCLSITPPGLKVENFKIEYKKYGIPPGVPRITIGFLIVPIEEKLKNYFSFNIQTTVSARQL